MIKSKSKLIWSRLCEARGRYMGELEDVIEQMEVQNQQLQSIMLQKQACMMQEREVENALEELKKVETQEIFKSIGPILVKTGKESITKELEEVREELELKIKTLERQEKRVKEKLREDQEKFQRLVPRTGEGG